MLVIVFVCILIFASFSSTFVASSVCSLNYILIYTTLNKCRFLKDFLNCRKIKNVLTAKLSMYLEEFKRDDLDIIRNFMARSPEETM